jgi:hypothetical protein
MNIILPIGMLCDQFTALISIPPRYRDLNMNNFMMEWKNMFPDGFHP